MKKKRLNYHNRKHKRKKVVISWQTTICTATATSIASSPFSKYSNGGVLESLAGHCLLSWFHFQSKKRASVASVGLCFKHPEVTSLAEEKATGVVALVPNALCFSSSGNQYWQVGLPLPKPIQGHAAVVRLLGQAERSLRKQLKGRSKFRPVFYFSSTPGF